MADSRQRVVFAIEPNGWPALTFHVGRSKCCRQAKMLLNGKSLQLEILRKSVVRSDFFVGQLGVVPNVK